MKNGETSIPLNPKDAANRIPAVEKTVRILHLLAGEGRGLPSKAIAAEVGASPSTCYRILKTLEVAGWVAQDGYGGFQVGKGLLPLVEPLSEVRNAVRVAQPVLQNLAREQGITAKLCSRQGANQITVAVGLPSAPVGILAPLGVPYPIVEAASGAALLSDLSSQELDALIERTPVAHWQRHTPEALRDRVAQCHDKGWCQNIGHHPQGIDAIACPLRMGNLRLALCLIGFRGDLNDQRLPELCRRLMDAKQELETIFVS